MTMASLNASLLARKGSAFPATQTPRHLASVPGEQGARSASKYKDQKTTKKKHFRIGSEADKDLRLLAVREGLSQQALIEKALHDYLDQAFEESGCICRTRR